MSGRPPRPRILYWFRTPPDVKLGRTPFDESVRKALEAQYPDVRFDWKRITETQPPPVSEGEVWRERRRAERSAKQARQAAKRERDEVDVDVPAAPDGVVVTGLSEVAEAGEPSDDTATAHDDLAGETSLSEADSLAEAIPDDEIGDETDQSAPQGLDVSGPPTGPAATQGEGGIVPQGPRRRRRRRGGRGRNRPGGPVPQATAPATAPDADAGPASPAPEPQRADPEFRNDPPPTGEEPAS